MRNRKTAAKHGLAYVWFSLIVILVAGCAGPAKFVMPENDNLEMQACREEARTADGLNLGIKRYKVEGGQPLILQHGWACNNYNYDLPVAGHSLGRFLARQGYDVWMTNFRGHGQKPYQSDTPPKPQWNFDDYAIYDVPALIKKVREATGRRPIWIGHSLGGMTLSMYLEGAEFNNQQRVTSSAAVAESRNQELAGFINIAGPPGLNWPVRLDRFEDWWRLRLRYRDEVSAQVQFLTLLGYHVHFLRHITDTMPSGKILNTVGRFGFLSKSYLTNIAFFEPNMSKELASKFFAIAMQDSSIAESIQWTEEVHNGKLREYIYRGKDPYVYNDHFNRITLPLFALAGDQDMLCNDRYFYDEYFVKVGSKDKTFFNVPFCGHVDLVCGLNAPSTVYPRILDWIKAHEDRSVPPVNPPEIISDQTRQQ